MRPVWIAVPKNKTQDTANRSLLTREGEVELFRQMERGLALMRRAVLPTPLGLAEIEHLASRVRSRKLRIGSVVDSVEGAGGPKARRGFLRVVDELARGQRAQWARRRRGRRRAGSSGVEKLGLDLRHVDRIARAHEAALERLEAGSAREGDSGLSLAELRAIVARVREGRKLAYQARDEVFECNLPLVAHVAWQLAVNQQHHTDLVQEGGLGLMRAIEKFDYRRACKFATYATWWIRQACVKAIHNQYRTIRVPAHVLNALNRIQRTE